MVPGMIVLKIWISGDKLYVQEMALGNCIPSHEDWKSFSNWFLWGDPLRKRMRRMRNYRRWVLVTSSLDSTGLLLWRIKRIKKGPKDGGKKTSKGDHLDGPLNHICGPDVLCNQSTCPPQKAGIICSTRSVVNVKVWRNLSTWQTKFVIYVTSKPRPQRITALWGHLIMIKWTKN